MKPHKIYAENLEPSALDQFNSAMELDCVVAGALMPDAHTGYSLPIGAVVATDGVIFPSWVGYDIGCGMCAIPTTFNADDVRNNAHDIHTQIHRDIPTGFNQHSKKQPLGDKLNLMDRSELLDGVMELRKARFQIGTLGGGNHFIEIGVDEHDIVWVIIHSGSRGVGHGTAQEYMRLASPDGKVREGHYGFDQDSELGQQYIKDLNWCLEYALTNRSRMIGKAVEAAQRYVKGDVDWNGLINRNHNHAEKVMYQDRFGNIGPVWIHRKGATHAEDGMFGVIPGNMRDGCYIVKGKGNPESLCSSSHGAGRAMSRKKARENLSIDEFHGQMEGIKADVKPKTIDEAPDAYKNIHRVMELQTDLVDVLAYVRPILNVKGF